MTTRGKWIVGLLALMLLVFAGANDPAQATNYNDAATGFWTNNSTWNPVGYPVAGDTAIIDSHTVTMNISLTNSAMPASVTVSTGGTLQAPGGVSYIDAPLILNGGTLYAPSCAFAQTVIRGPVSVTADSLCDLAMYGSYTFQCPITGSAKLTCRFNDPDTREPGYVYFDYPQTNWTGALDIIGTKNGFVNVRTNKALGSTTVTVSNRLCLAESQNYGSDPKPMITINSGGTILFGDVYYEKVNSDLDVTMNGGEWRGYGSSSGGTFTNYGQIILNSNTMFHAEPFSEKWYLTGKISGSGQFRLNSDSLWQGAGTYYLSGTNTYSGGTWIQAGILVAQSTNALCTGDIQVDYNTTVDSHGILKLDQTPSTNWTLPNNFSGDGTVEVEGGAGINRLTAAGGTVRPGTNNGAAVAVLPLDGLFAFGRGGGHSSTLRVDVASAGTVAGTHYDQFRVDHGDAALAASITNCALALNVTPSASDLNGMTVTVVNVTSGPADFRAYQFASVTGTGSFGRVVYGSNTIQVTWDTGGPQIQNGAYTNLDYISCDVQGLLISTGAAPTEVSCYWGSNQMDKTGWGHTNYLGTNSIGTVTASLSGLTSNTTYYYRFYATNAGGENWAPTVSDFITRLTWNDAINGNWTADNADTWGQGTNVYPHNSLDDVVTVDSHRVGVASPMLVNVKALIVTTSGVSTGFFGFNTGEIASPITFNGGIIGTYTYNTVGGTLNGPITLTGTMHIQNLRGGNHPLRGKISGPGQINIYWADDYNSPGASLYNSSNDWTGGVLIRKGTLSVNTNRALSSGTVYVDSSQSLLQFNANQDYGSDPKPDIIITNGGVVYICQQTVLLPIRSYGGGATGYGRNSPTLATNLVLESGTTKVWSVDNQSYSFRLLGLISGPGTLQIDPSGWFYQGADEVRMERGTNTYTGGTIVAGALEVIGNQALGTGTVTVISRGVLSTQSGRRLSGGLTFGAVQNYAPGTQPLIQVETNGAMYVHVGANTNLDLDVTLNGGELSGYWNANGITNAIRGTVTLTTNSFLGGCYGTSELNVKSLVTGNYRLTKYANPTNASSLHITLDGPITLSNPSNNFASLEVNYNTLKIAAVGAQSTGQVAIVSRGTLALDIPGGSFDWRLTNNINGTQPTNGNPTIKLEDGAGTNTLTLLGRLDPGTNSPAQSTNDTGIFRIDGSAAFGSGSRLRIDITSSNGVAGFDYDRFVVDHTLTGLSNAVLEVNVNTNIGKVAIEAQSFIIVTNAASLSGLSFGSVVWNGDWHGTVTYNDPVGTVKLIHVSTLRRGMVITVQ